MQAMKARCLLIMQLSLFGILLVCFCSGCAGLNQKFGDSKVVQTLKDWQAAVKNKLSFDDQKTSPENDAVSQTKDSAADDASGSNPDPTDPVIHTVQQRGETLPIIAKWYTGNSDNWKALAAANPRINPQRIKIGSQVVIPADKALTREPISRKFADKHIPTYFEHRVSWPGESLSLISNWYTGEIRNWKKLVNHNPEINPKRIKIGQKIYIPTNLLKTRDPLPQKVAAKYLPNYFAYRVQRPGESLTDIAKWYTGDPKNWKVLVRANPDIDPKFLAVGHEIYIPGALLKTRKPIPQTAEDPSEQNPEKKSPSAEPAVAPQKKPEIQLFGPKQFPKG